MEKTLVIYHGNCADGFTGAWVIWRHLIDRWVRETPDRQNEFNTVKYPEIWERSGHLGGMVTFHPGNYNEKNAPLALIDQDTRVIIVDFSYAPEELMLVARTAKSLLWLDHHKTAIEAYHKFNEIVEREPWPTSFFCDLDIERSGAMIAWEWFFVEEPPRFLSHVQDRDLWKFSMYGTREVNANLFSYEYTFENWDRMMYEPTDKQITEGAAIDRKHLKDCREVITVCTRRMDMPIMDTDGEIRFHAIEIPVCNVPYFHGSDVANILAAEEQKNGRPAVAGYYYDTPSGRNFGFRSIGDFDCSRIAKALGGGGHKNASGANKVPARIYYRFEVGDKDGIPHDV